MKKYSISDKIAVILAWVLVQTVIGIVATHLISYCNNWISFFLFVFYSLLFVIIGLKKWLVKWGRCLIFDIFIVMSSYKIKLEDKAAFLNRLEKQGIAIDSFDIKDNKLKGYFEFTIDDSEVNSIVKTILKQSPKINRVHENKVTKSQLIQIVREELNRLSK